MSYMLPHLHNGWQVDQAILSEEDRVVVIRFGHDWDPTCMKMDEVLYSIAEKEDVVSGVSLCSNLGGLEVPGTRTHWLKNPCRARRHPGRRWLGCWCHKRQMCAWLRRDVNTVPCKLRCARSAAAQGPRGQRLFGPVPHGARHRTAAFSFTRKCGHWQWQGRTCLST
ncbi:thioredoxin-like protein 4A isoform X1 [Lutra lutra]|uniref:thioredoxin-like protein 4A isoform X1 n=1 Tax=Lutra lutra TaxID=9657 RepID=UPI001FD1BB50|nr:thioredoxin-like protein 4A isoform X1 [Lutra lutra]XP_047554435.1 thioredoxin-like protein 4A isoform X1 [Lutra lutra]XP_047554436.1 thioredoxin-like protein 4A isoform X1 [Lutra lutra]XP_047554441.1 thioredoxin-like protein 4A isoform X1 [Lutra lutra]